MKNFNEFINESKYDLLKKGSELTKSDWEALDKLSEIINKDASNSKLFHEHFFARFDIFHPVGIIIENEEVISFPLEIELKLDDIKVDIPEYFNKVKEFFSKYYYVKMEKATSTNYYRILFDYKKLSNSNLFKSLKGKSKFKI